MTDHLLTRSQYMRTLEETTRLEKLIEAGTATERDRHRYQQGMSEELAWEWAGLDTKPEPIMPPLPEEAPREWFAGYNPHLLRFREWYHANATRFDTWQDAFADWWNRPTMDEGTAEEACRLMEEDRTWVLADVARWNERWGRTDA